MIVGREDYGDVGTIDLADIRPLLRAQRAADVIETPTPAEIVESVVWAGCITIIASESGAGKTFVLLDLAAAIDAGIRWHGRHTASGSVVYLSFEGDALGRRLRGLRDCLGFKLSNVYIIRGSDPLSPRVTRDGEEPSLGEHAMVEALRTLRDELSTAGLPPIVLVIVDTIRASLSGSEDLSEHAAAYLRAIKRLLAVLPEAGALLAHHAGWQDGDSARKRERGSSAWRGNCDATLYLEAGEYNREAGDTPLKLHTLKTRDAERPTTLHLIRRSIELPGEMDRHGQPVTTCVIERDRRTREDLEAERLGTIEQEQTAKDRATLQVIADRPDLATSIDSIRPALNWRKTDVSASVARLIRLELVTPGGRRQPYAITPKGRQWLIEDTQS